MKTVADERGFTLIEMLVTCTLMIIVMGATLTSSSLSARSTSALRSKTTPPSRRAGTRS